MAKGRGHAGALFCNNYSPVGIDPDGNVFIFNCWSRHSRYGSGYLIHLQRGDGHTLCGAACPAGLVWWHQTDDLGLNPDVLVGCYRCNAAGLKILANLQAQKAEAANDR